MSNVISVIIRTFNEEQHIGRLIDGIQRQVLEPADEIEIIVVDSGSTDSTISIASHMGAKTYSIAKEDFTFGRALNYGCEKASGNIFLFASAHVYPLYYDWIAKMCGHLKTDNSVGLVYGRQIGNEKTKFSEHEVFHKWFPENSNYDQLTPFCNNANTAIRRDQWKEIKFDESLTGLEDIEWGKRILHNGYRIIYEAEAVIVHVHEESYPKIKNRYQREAMALKVIMPNVSFSFFDFIRLFIFNTFSDLLHSIRQGVFLNKYKSIVAFRFMQFWGTFLGHRYSGNITRELKDRFYYPNNFKKNRKQMEQLQPGKKLIDYN